jgi:hypothetical protein
MSPPVGEGCWALAGLQRFLEDQASLFRRHSFISVLISENKPRLSNPATMSTFPIANHCHHHHGNHPSSLLLVLASTSNKHLITSTTSLTSPPSPMSYYSQGRQQFVSTFQISSHHLNPILILTSNPMTKPV